MSELRTYYNARCPVCRPAIERYARTGKSGEATLDWCDINRDKAALCHLGITADDVRKRLHVIDDEGRVLVDVAAFEALWGELEGYGGLARVIRLPGVRRLAHWAYEALAAVLWWHNRRRTNSRVDP